MQFKMLNGTLLQCTVFEQSWGAFREATYDKYHRKSISRNCRCMQVQTNKTCLMVEYLENTPENCHKVNWP